MRTVRSIPGYSEAIEREETHRVEAWLGLEEPIYGVEMSPLTLRRLMYLAAAKNPFVEGASHDFEYTPYAVGSFLWICSCDFVAGPGKHADRARKRFFKRLRKLPCLEVSQKIFVYLNESYFDLASFSGRSETAPKIGWVGAQIHRHASEYGWSVDEILDTPMKQLIQLDRCQLAGDSETAKLLSNPVSDGVTAAYLEARNSKKKESA